MATHETKNLFVSRRGFTIVEFMIATTVFGIVLMIVTFSIMHISKIYQRSINTSRTQAVARNIIENISQSLQYSDGMTVGSTPPTEAICFGGTKQFLFIRGARRVSEGTSVMTTKNITDTNCAAFNIALSSNPSDVGQQLVPINMRVSYLEVLLIPGSSLYQISVKVVYGDDDVLNNPSSPAASCKPGAGSEFCAISELATTVQARL